MGATRMKAAIAGLVLAVATVVLSMVIALSLQGRPPESSGARDAVSNASGKQAALLADRQEAGFDELAQAPRAAAVSRDGVRYRPGEVLVKVAGNWEIDDLNSRLNGLGYLAEQVLAPEDIALGWARLVLADGQDAEQAVARLVQDGVASDAQLNYVYSLDTQSGSAENGVDSADPAGSSEAVASDRSISLRMGASSDFVSNGVDDVPGPDDPEKADDEDLIQPDYASERYGAGFDPKVNGQWAIYATKADYGYKYLTEHLGEMGLESADDASVRPSIAVVDTGCYVDHEDLQANIVDYYDVFDDYNKAEDTRGRFVDVDGHGTNVSGVASAVTRNGVGIAGVGGNSGLVPIRVFEFDSDGELGAESYGIAKAYSYILSHALEDRIKVVNLSLGADYEEESADADDKALFEAIDKATGQGILTVSSAGNGGIRGAYCDFPTYLSESVIGSIAVRYTSGNADLGRSPFSNYNKEGVKVEQLSAPGSGVLTTASWVWNGSRWLARQDAYEEVSGTSFAAPCISGAAAFVWAVNPGLSVDEMKSVLYSSARDIVVKGDDDLEENSYGEGFDLMTGFGEVDVRAAAESSFAFLSGVASVAPGVSTTLVPHVAASSDAVGEWLWSSSDPQFAEVGNGVVVGKAPGAAVITASNEMLGVALKQVVTVHGATITGANHLYLGSGDVLSIAEPLANNGVWKWSSSNPGVVSVGEDSGSVYGAGLGEAVVTAQLSSNPSVQASCAIQVTSMPEHASPSGSTQSMHRLYNPNSGEHFYTASDFERDSLTGVGWRYEGVGWTAPVEGADVYRLYNPNAGDHHYTASAVERDALRRAGWRYEGVGWRSAGSSGVPIYRQYNRNARAGAHNYTTSKAENDYLVRIGWSAEGIGWYGA